MASRAIRRCSHRRSSPATTSSTRWCRASPTAPPASETGWLPVRSKEPDLVPEGPWFQWLFDVFTAPPGAEVIAESDLCPQAFVWGRSLGLQFHPEVTREIMDDWVRVYRHELDADGVDPDELMEETHRRIDDSNRMARQLLERFLERVAGIRAEETGSEATGAA